MSESNVENESRPEPPTVWQENHLSFLFGFLALIFFIGACILAYRQMQVAPPRFPDGRLIETADVNSAALSVGNEVVGERVSIVISGAAKDRGTMMVAIYGSAEGFNDLNRAIMRESVTITDGEATWVLAMDDLPEKFAVAAFHDENADGELNRNRIGIPTERYGFSNNARGVTGPPAFAEAVIDRPESGNQFTVYIR